MTTTTNLGVAKLWAAQGAKDHAKTHNGNMSFSGRILYSYSTPIGHMVPDINGNLVPLITAHSYSVTTQGKHIGPAHRATDHKAFIVPFLATGPIGRHRIDSRDLAEVHAGNLAHYAAKAKAEEERIARARVFKSPEWLDRINAECERYKATFGL